MQIFETENSRYILDLDNMLYKRESICDQYVHSNRLTYDEWHPLKSYQVIEDGAERKLHILHATSRLGIYTSPIIKDYEE